MKEVKLMTSVCTGALLLAKAGREQQHIGLVFKRSKRFSECRSNRECEICR